MIDMLPGNTDPLQARLRQLRTTAADMAKTVLAPRSQEVDRDAVWPAHAMRALGDARLMGLHVPEPLGGLGEGLQALAVVTEELAAACSSTAMCFGMHCVASKVIAVKATPDQEERFLGPIARGERVCSLALSEPGTGVHFYLPRTTFEATEDGFRVDGTKSFVTSGGHAHLLVASAVRAGGENDPGTFSCFVIERGFPGIDWQEPWAGLGMRGNDARTVRLDKVPIPAGNLLGNEGDEIWYVFDVIAPYFLVAMSGVYIGIARSALDEAIADLRQRNYQHTGQTLAEVPILTSEVADAWIAIERARQLLHHAARLADSGSPDAREAILACKIEVAKAAVAVTNTAMTLAGGRAYRENSRLAQLLRDARAAHVMAPSTHVLKTWLGRSLLGQPLL